jgi:hypothetical protein
VPLLLGADLHRAGLHLRKPPAFRRVGIPGSGGPDWLRNDYEFIICTARPGKLSWSDNTACGHTPKWAPGGEMSNRHVDGRRINAQLSRRDQWGGTGHASSGEGRKTNGEFKKRNGKAVHRTRLNTEIDGSQRVQGYAVPKLANPGNIIKCNVGGGLMGDELCHENEAPFPEKLAEFFILSFCPSAGTVCDVFSGSGTTAAMAKKHGREFIGCDIRQSQVDLALKRVARVQPLMFT